MQGKAFEILFSSSSSLRMKVMKQEQKKRTQKGQEGILMLFSLEDVIMAQFEPH